MPPEGVIGGAETSRKVRQQSWLTVGAMFAYTIGVYGGPALGLHDALLLAISAMGYFLTIYLYWGVARMAFQRQTYLLWVSGGLALLAGYMLVGTTDGWLVVTGWSTILVGSAIVGRMTSAGKRSQKVYLYGLAAVTILSILQFAPLWQDFMVAAKEATLLMLESAGDSMVAMGYGSDAVRESIDQTQRMLSALIRLIPAMTVLGVVMQFSMGFLIFAHFTGRDNTPSARIAPYIHWKIPFGVTPVLMAAILMRVLGNDIVVLAADNIILFLAVYYAIAGLALTEFFLRKFNFSRLMKILFYLMMFFAQLIGLFVLALLGFVDSFADWRRLQRLGTVRE